MKTEDVVSFLKAKGGYSPAANSLALLGMQLSFDAVMIGPEKHDGLVLIEQVGQRSLNLLVNKVKALALALERTESQRTLTLVILDCKAVMSAYLELNRLCRLFLLQDNDSLDVALASILPLSLPVPITAGNSADATLKDELKDELNDPFVAKLLKAAREGESEVEKSVRDVVEQLSTLEQSK